MRKLAKWHSQVFRRLIMYNIFSQKIKRTTGKDVWQEKLRLAEFAADKVRSSFGLKGAYKLVVYNEGPNKSSK
jgi:hypothetical protein